MKIKNIAILVLMLTGLMGISQEKEMIPFALVESAPVYPGCEGTEGKALKDCAVNKITNYVNTNFDTSLGKKLGLTGMNRIVVKFKIDDEGNVQDVQSRSFAKDSQAKKALEDEAKRVISGLPQMTPAKFKGKDTGILYSLPIAFAVPEKEDKKQ